MALSARPGTSMNPQAAAAVDEIAAQIDSDALDALLFFCSPAYDLDQLGAAICARFDCPIVGCTSSGQISPLGFQLGGLSALGIGGGRLRMTPHLISPLAECQNRAAALSESLHAKREVALSTRRLFGLLLVDGLSMIEERLTAALYQSLCNVPIIGGSAGDDLRFQQTHVYFGGRFVRDAAVFAVFESESPFAIFKTQHFVPTQTRLVITDADPEQRVIHEINGEPAARRYAEAVGVAEDALTPAEFSKHPLMLRVGDDYYVRSIQKVLPGGALKCYCAIDAGVVLTVGRGVDALSTLERSFAAVRTSVPDPALIIGCDCILRRLELEQNDQDRKIGAFFSSSGVFGFSTYGEQYNGIHVNQTFTGVAIGA